jgi:hypothetical protein
MTLTPEQLIAKAEENESNADRIVAEMELPPIVRQLREQAAGYRRIAARYQRESQR